MLGASESLLELAHPPNNSAAPTNAIEINSDSTSAPTMAQKSAAMSAAYTITPTAGGTQIKISGQRADLTEIEQALYEFAPQTQWLAAVNPLPSPHLCAYYATVTNWQPDLRALTQHLNGRLSGYAIPQRLIGVAHLPRTAHGKLDRRNVHTLTALHDTRRATP